MTVADTINQIATDVAALKAANPVTFPTDIEGKLDAIKADTGAIVAELTPTPPIVS